MTSIDNDSLVKFLIGMNQTKYAVLEELYRPYRDRNYELGVLLVDAHGIFSRLYREKKLASIYAGNRAELIRDLVVGFLNVLGHYRRFLALRLGLDNDIYVMFNRVQPVYNRNYFRDFNEELVRRYDPADVTYGFTNQALEAAWSYILGLSPYFEGIYCLDNGGIDDFGLMRSLEYDDKVLVTILSRNVYGNQLLRNEHWVQLHAKRDKSYLITRENCYAKGLLAETKVVASEKLTPEMLPLIWSIMGCKSVSMGSMKLVQNIKTMITGMNKMADDGYLTPDTTITGFLENVGPYVSLSTVQLKSSKSRIEDRYKALSARLSARSITSDQLARINAQVYDIYNQAELEQLNELLAKSRLDPEILHLENLGMSAGVRRDIYDGWE